MTASFLGGFVIAFVKGWLLTLAMLSALPFIVMSAAIIYFLRLEIDSRTRMAYADAANVVQQTIECIRTVSH